MAISENEWEEILTLAWHYLLGGLSVSDNFL